ncbi:MAG: adenosine-specific kinase [Vicinamibacterales bacterium]
MATPNTPGQQPGIELQLVPIDVPPDANVIIGQAHFIKTVEDLYEAVVTGVPQARFGLAFNEASGPCLIRAEANESDLREAAVLAARAIGAGHVFVLFIRGAYPINILNRIKGCAEVCSVFCATANPLQVVVAETPSGRGVLGVIDGNPPAGVETDTDRRARHEFLRAIGYKL